MWVKIKLSVHYFAELDKKQKDSTVTKSKF